MEGKMECAIYLTKSKLEEAKKALRKGTEWTVTLGSAVYEQNYCNMIWLSDPSSDDATDRLSFYDLRIIHKGKRLTWDDEEQFPLEGESITIKFNNQQRRHILRHDWTEYDDYSEHYSDYSDGDYSG